MDIWEPSLWIYSSAYQGIDAIKKMQIQMKIRIRGRMAKNNSIEYNDIYFLRNSISKIED